MAAAEARAVWQRTANRCFVQEDAKRAPKLACCQSSNSTSNKVDSGPSGAADGQDQPAIGFMPLNRSPSYSSLPPDTRWWLQLQPSYGYQKGLTYEQINALEAEVQALIANPVSEGTEIHQLNKGDYAHVNEKKSNQYSPECTVRKENYEAMETDCSGCPVSKQSSESPFDLESPWIGAGKREPWWRTTDREELASLVAQKSLDHIENCDLPPPQKTHVRRLPYAPLGHSVHEEISTSFSNDKGQTGGGIHIPPLHAQGSPSSGRRHWASIEEQNSLCGSSKSFSPNTTILKDSMDKQLISDGDPSKAQLLEALRHSQTRAREAEKAAKQAYAEKEHIVRLFFKQASQLFAYKQWFQLLQLESLYLQIKNNDRPISTLFPMVLPYKGRKLGKSWHKAAKCKRLKRSQPRHDVASYAVAFALGLSLVGAGLLLGWTVGWLLL